MSSKEAQERKVPVLRSDCNLIDQEFDSIREKFELEMCKMEKEMDRFRSQLIRSERNRSMSPMPFSSSTSSSDQMRSGQQTTSTSSVTRTSTRSVQTSTENSIRRYEEQEQQALSKDKVQSESKEQKSIGTASSWLVGLDSPLIKDSNAGKILKLQFDVSHYEPEQIVVRTLDNRLQVHAKREEKSENRSMYREYNREFLLPEGTNTELIKSSLSADGVLTVEAPLPINLYSQIQPT